MTERERAVLRDKLARARMTQLPPRRPPRTKPVKRATAESYLDQLGRCVIDLDRVVQALAANLANVRAIVEHDRIAKGWLEAEREIVRLRARLADLERNVIGAA